VFWIAGAFADDEARAAFWVLALVIDLAAPLHFYSIPGRPRLSHTTWEVETVHFAERFQLFMIIALGETIVLTGATTAGLDLDVVRLAAFALAFLGTEALWWLYFDYVARIAERRLALAPNRTQLARDGYTYLHAVLVAGIVLAAIGDELVISHPTEELPRAELLVVAGGPALYLLGHALFRLRMTGTISWKRSGAAVACLVVAAAGPELPALAVAGLVVGVLAAVIGAELLGAARRRARGEPSPLERLAKKGTADA
jgi:low temperature requirement protein LtrA